MKPIKATLLTCALAAGLNSLAAGPSLAQGCPANVASLASEIDEPQLQTRINEPLDDIVSGAGGLEPAITQWEQKLSDAQAEQAQFAQSGAPALTRAFDELVLILDRQLDGLRCRQDG